MTSLTRHVAITGAALATAGALVAAIPTINANHDLTLASSPAVTTVSSAIQLMSHSEWQGNEGGGSQVQGAGSYQGDDASDVEDSGDSDHHGWGGGGGGGGFGNISTIITDFLTNNQAQVLSVTSQIPVFNIGPVAVGNSLLANAYYTGFDPGTGVVTGLPGVVAYVTSQIGVPSGNLVQDVVLGLTSMTPQINIGPLAIGHGILANAYFNGYDSGSGNVTGLPGVISYVTSQLGIQATPGAAVKAAAVAGVPSVVAARSAAAVAASAAAENSAAGAAKADSPRASRSAAGRGVAKAAGAAAHAKASASRAAK